MPLWTPNVIYPYLWLDASDQATITISTGVSEWRDKSGNGRHATQTTGISQPSIGLAEVNGLDVLLFDGINDFLNCAFALAQPLTIYVVSKTTVTTGTSGSRQYVFDGLATDANRCLLALRGDQTNKPSIYGGVWLVHTASVGAGWALYRCTFSGSSSAVGVNAVNVVGDAGSRHLSEGIKIGCNYLASNDWLSGGVAELIICSPSAEVEGYLAWRWGLQDSLPVDHLYKSAAPTIAGSVVAAGLVGAYGDAPTTVVGFIGQYSLIMEQALIGRYGDAATLTAGFVGRYGNAAQVQAAMVGRYGDLVPVLAALEGRYHLMHSVLAVLEGRYAICESTVLAALEGRYDLRERGEILAALTGYYSLLPAAAIQQIVCPVRVGGVVVNWSSVSWTRSEDNYLIEATIILRDPSEFGSIAKLDTVEIVWDGITYTLFVSAKLRSRSVSGDVGSAEYGADYTIIARSLTAGLDAPYALPITMSWPATTLASAIAADLIAGLPELLTLDFRLEDWLQPGGTFFLTDETPLEGLRKLAAIIGGIVQTSPDNTVILRMADAVPPAYWTKIVPSGVIQDSDIFSDSETEAEYNAYNTITVTNQNESEETTKFVVSDITDYRKEVRGYKVPWVDFGLATSGGSWVTIEDGGVVEERVTDELVEFIDGASNSSLPVYSIVSVEWLHTQLGSITASEDGSLTSEITGCSLGKISYTSRCHLWIGNSDRDEETQFYGVEL